MNSCFIMSPLTSFHSVNLFKQHFLIYFSIFHISCLYLFSIVYCFNSSILQFCIKSNDHSHHNCSKSLSTQLFNFVNSIHLCFSLSILLIFLNCVLVLNLSVIYFIQIYAIFFVLRIYFLQIFWVSILVCINRTWFLHSFVFLFQLVSCCLSLYKFSFSLYLS